MIGKSAFVCLALLMAVSTAAAQVTVNVKAEPSRAVKGDTINFIVTVTGGTREVGHPVLKMPAGLRLLRGEPQVGQQYSIINGRVSQSVEFTYQVACVAVGTHRIPGPRVLIDGTMYTAEGVTVTVLKADTTARQQRAAVRLEAFAAPEAAVQGQAVSFTVRIYVPKVLLADGQYAWAEKPRAEGLIMESVGKRSGEWHLVTIGGIPTYVLEIGRFLATPTQTGKYRFFPGTARVVVRTRRRRRRRSASLFDSFFDDAFFQPRGKEVLVSGQPLELTVKALPTDGRPDDFSGMVSSGLKAVAGVTRVELKENESLTYKITLDGDGDLRSMPAPSLELGGNFRVFESKTHPSVRVDERGVHTRVTFEYVLVPISSGVHEIPPVSFSYFDPETGKYSTASTGKISLRVLPGEKEEVISLGSLATGGRTVKIKGRDINFIKEDRKEAVPLARPALHRRGLYWVITLLPLLLLLADDIYGRFSRLSAGDLLARRASRAYGEALRRLSGLKSDIDDGKKFYSGLRSVLIGYLADKLGLSPAGLVFSEVRSVLGDKYEMSDSELDDFAAFLETCESAAFSPAIPSGEERVNSLEEARRILDLVEKRLA